MITLTRKKIPWKGWKRIAPSRKQRTKMATKCGKKCFLGNVREKKYPICKKNTCNINIKGLWAAYIRSTQMSNKPHKNTNTHRKISIKAKRLIDNMTKKK